MVSLSYTAIQKSGIYATGNLEATNYKYRAVSLAWRLRSYRIVLLIVPVAGYYFLKWVERANAALWSLAVGLFIADLTLTLWGESVEKVVNNP